MEKKRKTSEPTQGNENSTFSFSKPNISLEEIEVVKEILESGDLTSGHYIRRFERQFAEFIGTKYAVAVSSGTSGLHLAVKSVGIKKGDEVITSPFSFIASTNSILYEGAKPVFADIDPITLNIDPHKIEEKINENTKGIMPVHIFGNSADMDPIKEIADKYNLKLIEDACEGLGSEYKGARVGSFGDAGVFGFFPNKQITTGEGGMIVTNNEEVYLLCRSMRSQGRGFDEEWLHHIRLGYNYRMSELSAGIGCVQLSRLSEIHNKKNSIADFYEDLLKDCYPYVVPVIKCPHKSWFIYPVFIKNYRDEIMQHLLRAGIECRVYFTPIHLQPFYKDLYNYKLGDYPMAEEISERILALPFHTHMTYEDVRRIVEILKAILSELY